jgi:hypothetical protein
VRQVTLPWPCGGGDRVVAGWPKGRGQIPSAGRSSSRANLLTGRLQPIIRKATCYLSLFLVGKPTEAQ